MCKLRVAVIYTHPLFGHGIARLLAEDPTLEVSCHLAESASPQSAVTPAGVDAFVIEDSEDSANAECFIQALPPALVAIVRLDDNAMEVYRGRRRILAKTDNLLDLLAQLPARRPALATSDPQPLRHRPAS